MKESVKENRLRNLYPGLSDGDISLIIESEDATFDGILPEKAETDVGFKILKRMASEAFHREEASAGLI